MFWTHGPGPHGTGWVCPQGNHPSGWRRWLQLHSRPGSNPHLSGHAKYDSETVNDAKWKPDRTCRACGFSTENTTATPSVLSYKQSTVSLKGMYWVVPMYGFIPKLDYKTTCKMFIENKIDFGQCKWT